MGVKTSPHIEFVFEEFHGQLLRAVEDAVAQAVAEALAPFEWQPDGRAVPEPGGLEIAVIGWRARCLKAEKRLASALEALEKMRQDLIDATGSAYARK